MSSAADKEERSGSQKVFKGEVAKIITRVWEENQGVARAQRRLGRSTVDGGNMLQPAKLQPWGVATSWEVPREHWVGYEFCRSFLGQLVV